MLQRCQKKRYEWGYNIYKEFLIKSKGQFRAIIFKSVEAVHGILLCYLADAKRCALSADLKIVACNRPFTKRSRFRERWAFRNQAPSVLLLSVMWYVLLLINFIDAMK